MDWAVLFLDSFFTILCDLVEVDTIATLEVDGVWPREFIKYEAY